MSARKPRLTAVELLTSQLSVAHIYAGTGITWLQLVQVDSFVTPTLQMAHPRHGRAAQTCLRSYQSLAVGPELELQTAQFQQSSLFSRTLRLNIQTCFWSVFSEGHTSLLLFPQYTVTAV